MRKLLCVVTLSLMIIALLAGCGGDKKADLEGNDELTPVSSISIGEDQASRLADKIPVSCYFANEKNSKLVREIKYVPMADAKKSTNSLAAAIVKELIAGPSANSGLKKTIPEGVELRSPISIDGGVAVVDFNKDFIDKHPGGKDEAKMTIYSIVNSLTELKEIQKVKFTIEGKETNKFKDTYQFDVPFPRMEALISKDSVKTSSDIDSNEANTAGDITDDGSEDVSGGDDAGEAADTLLEIEGDPDLDVIEILE